MATGGTPMSDGIQFGLDHLNLRNEAHRFLYLITDGEPNYEHRGVIKLQIRQAKEAGIHIVGVGIGTASQAVKTLFADHVYTDRVSDLPKLLIAKTNELVKSRIAKRGQRLKSVG